MSRCGSSSTACRYVYDWLLERCRPAQILVDKTPAYARERRSLDRAESYRPFYIWLIRHPLAVAASKIDTLHRRRRGEKRRLAARAKYPLYLARHAWRQLSGSEVERHVRYWDDLQRRIREFLAGVDPARQCVVHYEELVRDPEGEIKRIADRMHLSTTPQMLAPWQNAPSELEWGIGDEKLLQSRSIDVARADAWRARFDERALPVEVRQLLAELAGDPLRRQPSVPVPEVSPLPASELTGVAEAV